MPEIRDIDSATYSPDDNKLRMYPRHRLDADLYKRVRSLGFRWAPRQELFVCPRWTPEAAELCIELAGELIDEDTSLVERSEERADRFDEYSVKRAADAESAFAGVERITSGIPMGQPILVGHHSEKHARADQKRIENGMRRAIKMNDTSEYWTRRAAGAISAALYKESPPVRIRRIKRLESERRKVVASYTPHGREFMQSTYTSEGGYSDEKTPHVLAGNKGRGAWPVEVSALPRIEAASQPWLDHYDMRLTYERAMLAAEGVSMPEPRKRPKLPPILNFKLNQDEELKSKNLYNRGEFLSYDQRSLTKAEWKVANRYDGGSVRLSECGTFRFRTTQAKRCPGYVPPADQRMGGYHSVCVFLTDQKAHDRPESMSKTEPIEAPDPDLELSSYGSFPRPGDEPIAPAYVPPTGGELFAAAPCAKPEQSKFELMRASLNAGVQAVSAPSLFVTPDAVICRMMDAAEIEPGMSVLEPSAGTGALASAVRRFGANPVMVEINSGLAWALNVPGFDIKQCDFMEYFGGPFDRVVMNPPFERGQDREHVEHAYNMMKPGGRLVAIMGEGVFFRSFKADQAFRDWLESVDGTSEKLPDGSFKESGTGVACRMVVIDRPGI